MADTTNAGTPSANTTLSGDTARQYAIKRLMRQQRLSERQVPGRLIQPPEPTIRRQ